MLDVVQKLERAFEKFDKIDSSYKSDLLLGEGYHDSDDLAKCWEINHFFVAFL